MWYKLFLLLLYLVVLFLLARMLELLSWYEAGTLSDKLLDPMTLSVRKLKLLLDARGVSYESVVERHHLDELVESSGAITEDDLEATLGLEDDVAVTNFTNGNHFYEEVEDKKDSVWLIQIQVNHMMPPALSQTRWKAVRKKMAPFGIRAGVFDCSFDWRFCQRKGWTAPQLVLAHPDDFQHKANIILNTYLGPIKSGSIYHWVRQKLNQKIKCLKNFTEVQNDWLNYTDRFSEIRVIILTQLSTLPLFFSALSVKFPGRVRFGTVDTKTKEGKDIIKKFKLKKTPGHLVITSERSYYYGSRPGEALTFKHIELFLRSLYPEANDLFLLSLFACNVMSCLEFILTRGGVFRRLINLMWTFFKYNLIVIILWLPLLGLFQLSLMEPLVNLGLKSIRIVNSTYVLSLIRKDYFLYSIKWSLLAATSVAYAFVVCCVEYKKSSDVAVGDIEEDRSEWDFSNFRTLSHLFMPMSRRPLGFGMYLYTGMEERVGILPSPSLWPSNVDTSYINQLPTWKCREELAGKKTKPPGTEICKEPADIPATHSASNLDTGRLSEDSNSLSVERPSPDMQHASTAAESSDKASVSAVRDTVAKTTQKEVPIQKQPESFACSNCAICLDVYAVGALVCGLPCGHVFHKSCVVIWLSDNHICPLCRWPANKPKICHLHLHRE